MGFLRVDGPMLFERLVIERRAASIGTVLFRGQRKRAFVLSFWLALAMSSAAPAAAHAAETAAAPVENALPASTPATAGTPAPIPPVTASPVVVPLELSAVHPGAPGSDLPALPRPPRGVHLHDGFYLRMALGVGIAGALVASDSNSVGDYSFGGAAAAIDLWIGGSPTPGLAMGAALSGFGLSRSQRSVDGQRVSGDVTGGTGLLGYFVDVFPEAERGLHFGGALGIASSEAEVKDSDRKFRGGGLGLEAWAGYEYWVSAQWSLGGVLRLMGSLTREEKDSVAHQASLGAATLSFTALYH